MITIKITARQKIIFDAVRAVGSTDLETLTKRLKVSKRTVQRDIQKLNAYLLRFGVSLSLVSPGTVAINGKPEDVSAIAEQFEQLPEEPAFNPKERDFYIATELLASKGPIKMAYFSHRLKVTEASISFDLDRLTEWFESRRLVLVRKRGYGVEVLGSEKDKREALVDLVHEFLPVHQLIQALQTTDFSRIEGGYAAFIPKRFGEERLQEIKRIIREELQSIEPPLDDVAFYSFVLHVLVSLDRVSMGMEIELSEANRKLVSSMEYLMVERILRRLDRERNWEPGEIAYLAGHLRGARAQWTEEAQILPLKISAVQLAYRIVANVSDILRTPLTDDHQLISALAQHLEPAINRITLGLSIRNPLAEDIRHRYPRLFEAVSEASAKVIEPYGYTIPDEEIGYLTMHIGAAIERRKASQRLQVWIVCPNGISSAQLLAERVRKEFPQLVVAGITAIGAIDRDDCDLAISTVPLDEQPSVTVSPFLTEEDIKKVQACIENLSATPRMSTASSVDESGHNPQDLTVAKEIAENVTLTCLSASSTEMVVQEIAQHIHRLGLCTSPHEVYEVIMAREKLGSVVIPGKAITLLHARTDDVHRCYVGLYRLMQPIAMKSIGLSEEKVEVVLVILARRQEPPEVIRQLGKISAALIADDDFVSALKEAGKETIQEKMLNILLSLERES